MSAENRLKENSIIPLVFNQMFNRAGGVRDDGWLHGAPLQIRHIPQAWASQGGTGYPLCLLDSLQHQRLSFLLISEVMGHHGQKYKRSFYRGSSQHCWGERIILPSFPSTLPRAFVLKFSLLLLSFLAGSFLFFSHLHHYLFDKTRIPLSDNTVGLMSGTEDRFCPGLAEGRHMAPVSLQKSQLRPRKPEEENGDSPW